MSEVQENARDLLQWRGRFVLAGFACGSVTMLLLVMAVYILLVTQVGSGITHAVANTAHTHSFSIHFSYVRSRLCDYRTCAHTSHSRS